MTQALALDIPDVLARICSRTLADLPAQRAALPDVEAAAAAAPPARGFRSALESKLREGRTGLIAEIKKASPSAGLIRPDFDPVALALAYQEGGAACLSILTDAPFFQGSPETLVAARSAVRLPVLRKDFLLDPWQVWQARAMGADAVLVIMACLDDRTARRLTELATSLGMDVLVEVHDRPELDRALALGPGPLLGINNRNLRTLKVDLATVETLAPLVPPDRLLVAESGLSTPSDLARMAAAGARCALVGESLMRQPDIAAATRALLS